MGRLWGIPVSSVLHPSLSTHLFCVPRCGCRRPSLPNSHSQDGRAFTCVFIKPRALPGDPLNPCIEAGTEPQGMLEA